MGATINSLDLDILSVDERLRLIEALWDSVTKDSDAIPLSSAQRAELDRRLADSAAKPDEGARWTEVRASLSHRLRDDA